MSSLGYHITKNFVFILVIYCQANMQEVKMGWAYVKDMRTRNAYIILARKPRANVRLHVREGHKKRAVR
jgi:hypothetical protein